jgi:clan AA aspartic protease
VKGQIDPAGRALLTLKIRADSTRKAEELVVWVDTAFDGELVLPGDRIQQLGLNQSAAVQATLADGTSTILETFDCEIEWFGVWRHVQVVSNQGQWPLLGVGLLRGRKLTVDYGGGELLLE